MLSLLLILFRGALIGVLVSAPMGPIGMLCIQRTLAKGRLSGLFTGIGASVSDFIYCLLTGLGLSFVTDFIETHQALLQIIGSVLLMAYAVYLFRTNPTAMIQAAPSAQRTSLYRDMATGFLLTFSNPLILFFIIGLFARFSFLAPEFRAYHYVAGYLAIAGGALLWWLGVTKFVDKMRSHFNLRSMRTVNRIISCLLLLMAGVGLVTGMAG